MVRPSEARRALVLHDRQLVVDLIELTLNHGVFEVRAAADGVAAEAILAEWHPHLAVIDMDHDDSTGLLQRLGALLQAAYFAGSIARMIAPSLSKYAVAEGPHEPARLA